MSRSESVTASQEDKSKQFVWSCRMGDIEGVRAILDSFSSVKDRLDFIQGNHVNEFGEPFLFLALNSTNEEVVKLLLENGANPNPKKHEGRTILGLATEYGFMGGVKSLLESGANVNEKNSEGSAPLHLAAFRGQVEIVKLLLAYGADVNIKKEESGVENITPLYEALRNFFSNIQGAEDKAKNVAILLNANYESPAVNCDKDLFKQILTVCHLANFDPTQFHYIFVLIQEMCRLDDPLSAKAISLLILANPGHEDEIKQVLKDNLTQIKTPQMAHYVKHLFAHDQQALGLIPADLNTKLDTLKAEIADSNDQRSLAKYSGQTGPAFDVFAKRVAGYICNNKECGVEVALNSYLTLKAFQDRFEWASKASLTTDNEPDSLKEVAAKEAVEFLLVNNRNKNNRNQNFPTEIESMIVEKIFIEALDPVVEEKILPKNLLEGQLRLALPQEQHKHVTKAGKLIKECTQDASKAIFKAICKRAITKEFDRRKEERLKDQNSPSPSAQSPESSTLESSVPIPSP